MNEFYESQERVRPIPQQRVIEKMDEYMDHRDYAGAERHLLYWLEEARAGRDLRGALLVRNELIGHYRKTGERDKAVASVDDALKLLDALGFEGTISAGTTYVNIATALNAFGENERSMALFEKALALYESSPAIEPQLLGGLYNNMALTCVALKRFDEGMALFEKAMAQMENAPHGALEQAVTRMNQANLVEARDGMEAGEGQIYRLVEQVVALLDRPDLDHDGYYAYVCKTCVPTMEYYGYFADAQRFNEEAERIYAGS